ncbi:MAG: hypothetical protein NT175_14180 [Bacteroidetes bacterium]|nr:hypothetical protein [Bacteroidota bacterium]
MIKELMADKIRIKLTDQQIEILSRLPEQGMGYQIVDIKMKNGKILKEKVVINSTYLQLDITEQIDTKDIDTIQINSK